MKTILSFAVFTLILFSSCKNNANSVEAEAPSHKTATNTYEISVNGMTCTGCENTIENAVSQLEGVQTSKASHEAGKVMVEFIPGKTDSTQIKEAINGTGYSALSVQLIEE